jgi:hypothetical protein
MPNLRNYLGRTNHELPKIRVKAIKVLAPKIIQRGDIVIHNMEMSIVITMKFRRKQLP